MSGWTVSYISVNTALYLLFLFPKCLPPPPPVSGTTILSVTLKSMFLVNITNIISSQILAWIIQMLRDTAVNDESEKRRVTLLS